ncbi:hypothetical protein BSL78_00919 [Apostichopus japonicus]|uniref:Uncharacterized protein n=1 Tax=Stichopus japonicus TaxID=307972 RepID=A0A2G8LPL2_STIJA|nr:hypothetical protein BSL78_00919 [Apostichopus japonicus]
MCRAKQKKERKSSRVKAVAEGESDNSEDLEEELLHIHAMNVVKGSAKANVVEANIEGVPISMEVDTGQEYTNSIETFFKKLNSKVKLHATKVVLKTYLGDKIPVHGKGKVRVHYNGHEQMLPIYVVEGNGPALMGRDWLLELPLDWQNIKKIQSPNVPKQNIEEHTANSGVFNKEIGKLKGVHALLQ